LSELYVATGLEVYTEVVADVVSALSSERLTTLDDASDANWPPEPGGKFGANHCSHGAPGIVRFLLRAMGIFPKLETRAMTIGHLTPSYPHGQSVFVRGDARRGGGRVLRYVQDDVNSSPNAGDITYFPNAPLRKLFGDTLQHDGGITSHSGMVEVWLDDIPLPPPEGTVARKQAVSKDWRAWSDLRRLT